MSVGVRVVRGPDWNQNEADGGEGHLGTVVGVKAEEVTAEVVWDNGQVTTCRVGKEGKHDLRILDNAQAGVKHARVACNGCRKSPLFGVRWRCVSCPTFDLCSVCYVTNVHDLSHTFSRITVEGERGVEVGSRQSSVNKVRLVGIFPGARVTRGRDWLAANADGGAGGVGTVVEVVSPESGSARNAVRVSWDSGQSLQHRLGLHGKVDLVCTENAPGPACYLSHLPLLDILTTGQQASTAVAKKTLRVGDSVRVGVELEVLKDIQKRSCGWSVGMQKCIGKTGKVTAVTAEEHMEVQFEEMKWRISPDVLEQACEIAVGDMVRIISDEQQARQLQGPIRGGWNDIIAKSLGKVGQVKKIYSDGDLKVEFGLPEWRYHSRSCQPAPGCQMDNLAMDGQEVIEVLRKHFGDAAEGRAGQYSSEAVKHAKRAFNHSSRAAILLAISNGNLEKVKALIDQQPELINGLTDRATPLHIAADKGHADIVSLLLERGADMNRADKEGDTPLIRAAVRGHEGAVRELLIRGAGVNICTGKSRTALHKAAFRNFSSICRLLLEHGANPNMQDTDGDSALMDALQVGDNVDSVQVMLSFPGLDLRVTNKRGLDALRLCALKDRPRSAELILAKDKSLLRDSSSGNYVALHMAAVNNHSQMVQILIRSGADINALSSNKQTALHMAAEEVHIDIVMLLLQNGVNINAMDRNGDTALHVVLAKDAEAIRLLLGRRPVEDRKRLQVANFLIQHGARLDLRNSNGKAPLQVPSDSLRREVEAFMKDNGISSSHTPRDSNEKAAQKEEEGKCIRCSTAEASVIFLPCAHKITCLGCGPSISHCPRCGAQVKVKVDIHGDPVK